MTQNNSYPLVTMSLSHPQPTSKKETTKQNTSHHSTQSVVSPFMSLKHVLNRSYVPKKSVAEKKNSKNAFFITSAL
jgi:hypothetical protein